MRKNLERDELRHAIWLDPDSRAKEQLLPIMSELRQRIPGPVFSPHLTLTSGITGIEEQLVDQLVHLAKQQPPFWLKPAGIRVSGDFFRAITVRVDSPDSLLRFRQEARQCFALHSDRPFEPHLSLLYGEIDDVSLAELRSELDRVTWPTMHIQRCSLWRLQGPVSNWRQIADIGLTG